MNFDVQQLMPKTYGVELGMFVILAGIAAISALGVILFKAPVRSALCLVANFLSLAVLYFLLQSEMIGIIQVVVYTGAIMVLFLFVIMLLNLGAPDNYKPTKDLKTLLAVLMAGALFLVVTYQAILPMVALNLDEKALARHTDFGTPMNVGQNLLTNFVWPFEMASVLLLVGIVGSILLVKRRKQ